MKWLVIFLIATNYLTLFTLCLSLYANKLLKDKIKYQRVKEGKDDK